MFKKNCILSSIVILIMFSFSNADDYVSVPVGTRSLSMGGTGYILSDDESALFYNPAGLGLKNDRWDGGAVTCSHMHLLEYSNKQMVNTVYQNNKIDRFGFALSYILQSNPMKYSFDFNGNITKIIERAYISSINAGIGYQFFSRENISNSVGLALKNNIRRTYGRTNERKNGPPICIDAGYLFQLYNRFRIGIVLRNVGQDMNYISLSSGISGKHTINTDHLHLIDLASEISFLLYFKQKEIIGWSDEALNHDSFQTGFEFILIRSIILQIGYNMEFNHQNYDRWGNDLFITNDPETITVYSLPFGFGISLFNHFEFNYSTQKSISFSCKRLLTWNKSDLHWWRKE